MTWPEAVGLLKNPAMPRATASEPAPLTGACFIAPRRSRICCISARICDSGAGEVARQLISTERLLCFDVVVPWLIGTTTRELEGRFPGTRDTRGTRCYSQEWRSVSDRPTGIAGT